LPTSREESSTGHSDDDTFLIFPINPLERDAVTISFKDLKLLEPGGFLNDNLVDFWMKLTLQRLQDVDSEKRKHVYAFSCLFYAKLRQSQIAEEAHQLVAKWTKMVDIFSMKCLLFPINMDKHWSLVVLWRPDILKPKNTEVISIDMDHTQLPQACTLDSSAADKPAFLHYDSLNMHPTDEICTYLASYIWFERKKRLGFPPSPLPSSQMAKLCSETAMDIAVEGDEQLRSTPALHNEEHSFDSFVFGRSLGAVQCEVLQQPNGCDCGLYVLSFAEEIIRKCPSDTPSTLMETWFQSVSVKNAFMKKDFGKFRSNIKSVLHQ
jgi:Ulp1 family protease